VKAREEQGEVEKVEIEEEHDNHHRHLHITMINHYQI
jgi:hypothetical protein